MYLIFDTETTGLPRDWKAPPSALHNWPRIVQLAWQLCDQNGEIHDQENLIIYPDGFEIPEDSSRIHGITTAQAKSAGIPLVEALMRFQLAASRARSLVAHNIAFDEPILQAELIRCKLPSMNLQGICTMKSTVQLCKIKNRFGYKWPNLTELHEKLFEAKFDGAHDASVDVEMCKKCFFELKKRGVL